MIPDYDAVLGGLAEASDILRRLQSDEYTLTPDYLEAKSLATICTIILGEVTNRKSSGDFTAEQIV